MAGTRNFLDILPDFDWWDQYQGEVAGAELNSLDTCGHLFDRPPAWIKGLMTLRNRIVSLFGLKTVEMAAGASTGGFPILTSSPSRTVLGFDDRHLDFRLVVDLEQMPDRQLVKVITLVRRKNLFGRCYIFFVGPFHRRIVPASMQPFCENVRPVKGVLG